ncbi:MtsA protein [Corallococcus sp. Z5C101001]|uniref:MtsA protein n=1 Tax=Corallococcus sp. Z5C101001 TaxID=2596829 RepID=UPI00118076F1|nr:MtsA protein [Corallococcus sp. Z5C101001]TSC33724.1 MtsA protein [Corallococcus sp. Z5C101001]
MEDARGLEARTHVKGVIRRGRWIAAGVGALVLLGLLAVVLKSRGVPPPPPPEAPAAPAEPRPILQAVGPKLTSNQTSQPLSLYGEALVPGLRLVLGAPFSREVPLTVVDPRHAYARLPADLSLPPGVFQTDVQLSLAASAGPRPTGATRLTVVNDAAFPDLMAMALAPDGRTLFIASPPTDTVFALDVASGSVEAMAVGDGPAALATWKDSGGHPWLGVAHQSDAGLWLYALDAPERRARVLPAPPGVWGLEVDGAKGVAFLAEHVRDTVRAVALEDGRERWSAPVDPNPRALARWKGLLAVGSLQTGQVVLLNQEDGRELTPVVPKPGVPIVGGATEAFSEQVMGGKAPRALLSSERLGRVFMSSLGPNVGPNAQRMEVSANSGVAVLDLDRQQVVRHRGFGAGVTEGLALDDRAGLLYAADVALGQVRVLDAKALVKDDAAARAALLQTLPLFAPEGTPLIRPVEDLGTKGRAGVELHSGPRSLALAPDGRTLYVLNRFTGTVAVVDVREARAGKARVLRQWPVVDVRPREQRRLGQVLYFSDVGRTGMSCDACHIEGHTGGVFFEKTRPMRIYRSTTALGSRDTPPYFTPASTRSLAETAETVGGRNRYHNPDPLPSEVEALALYTSLLPTPPNPYRGPDGAPAETVTLPDGRPGHPAKGRALFEGQAGCAACHPAPLFTLDQDPSTRGRYLDVGTPIALPLRLAQQHLVPGAAPPSLVGTWDVWPLLTSATAGYAVREDRLVVGSRFPLRTLLETPGLQHGAAQALTPEERDDLLAYLLTL